MLITHQLVQAQQLYDDLTGFISEEEVHLYPVNELIASEIAIASPELRSQRIESLMAWSKNKSGILIAPVAALKRILPPPDYWEKYQLPFKLGEGIDVEAYLSSLVDMGYNHASMVTSPGEFSRRGGIIDVYPLTEKHPIRIELFDEEIDSIRYFDAETQRSLDKLKEITIGPATELLLSQSDIYAAGERVEEALAETLKTLKSKESKETLTEVVKADIERLKNMEQFQEMYKYIGYIYRQPASLLDYLPQDGLIIIDEMSRVQETAVTFGYRRSGMVYSLLHSGQMVKNSVFHMIGKPLWEQMKQQRLYMSVFLRHIPNTNPKTLLIYLRVMQEFHGQMHLLKNELRTMGKRGVFSCRT